MAPEETPDGDGRSLLSGLLAPLRLPERTLEALEAVAGAAGDLGDIRSELSAMRKEMSPLGELVPLTKDIKQQVKPMPATVERISGQAKPLEALLPTLEHLEQAVEQQLEAVHATMKALERAEARLNDQVEKLGGEIVALHGTVSGLKGDVERVTERLPDPARGPLEKARDVLTGGGDSGAGGES